VVRFHEQNRQKPVSGAVAASGEAKTLDAIEPLGDCVRIFSHHWKLLPLNDLNRSA
jgi:hypothetical protein